MFTNIFKVTSPGVIEKFIDNVEEMDNKVLVKVDMMAICKAHIKKVIKSSLFLIRLMISILLINPTVDALEKILVITIIQRQFLEVPRRMVF